VVNALNDMSDIRALVITGPGRKILFGRCRSQSICHG
jgi:hypothetical protein